MARKPLLIAHRGGYWPGIRENTLEAFAKSAEFGVDMIEFDVHRVTDDEYVVFHNQRVKGRRVGRLDKQRFIRLAGYKAPTFAEAVYLIGGRARLDIEIKNRGCIEAVVEALTVTGQIETAIVKSRIDSEMVRAKELAPTLKTGLIVDYPAFGLQGRLERAKVDYFVPWRWLWYSNFGLPKGFPVLLWTINTAFEMRRLAADPRIAGIISNKPAWLKKVLGS